MAKILLTTATDKGAAGVDPVYGYGLLNIAAAFAANGTVTLQTTSGATTALSGTTTTTTPMLRNFAAAMADVTVYDQFSRDFTVAEAGGLRQSANAISYRQLLGRRLLGASAMDDLTDSFFASEPQPRGFSLYGSPADQAGVMLALDRSTRMGVDLPVKSGMAQFRLTGGGDPRLDFAYDATMRPLGFFPSTSLLKGAFIGNALFALQGGRSRLMAYGMTTAGALEAHLPNNSLEMQLTSQGYMPRVALTGGRDMHQQQNGFGLGYWTQRGRNTVIGFNASVISQKGGWYSLMTNLADFNHPTRMFNFGMAAIRRFGNWELTASGELTHLRMAGASGALSMTPANLVSAEAGLRKSGIFANRTSMRDSLAFSIAMPPRAVSGNLRIEYLTPTADGLGKRSMTKLIPIARLGSEPVRAEAAYRLKSGHGWSFSLSGGLNLGSASDYGRGEAMAGFNLAL
jgi:hypothetical protein